MTAVSEQITLLLAEAGAGSLDAWNRLTPLIYDELRRLAECAMNAERPAHTLQPTALVHEAFVRLVGQNQSSWNNRTHFYGAAAETMRRILVDHARARKAQKRGGESLREPLDAALVSFEERSTDLIDLDAALSKLAALDSEQARIIELRFFGGLTVTECASIMGTSESSVERNWRTPAAGFYAR